MNNSVLIELHYFPSIEYCVQIAQSSHVFVEAHENYQKGSYRNRCHIATSQGKQVLSVPLKKGKNSRQTIREVAISYDTDWQKQHFQSIKTAYGSSPFWSHYAPMFEKIFQTKHTHLFDLNLEITTLIFKMLKLKTEITLTNAFETVFTEGVDLRNTVTPNASIFVEKKYAQVFENKNGFTPNLSVLDLIFCSGNQAVLVLCA